MNLDKEKSYVSRRDILRLGLVMPLAAALPVVTRGQKPTTKINLKSFTTGRSRVVPYAATQDVTKIKVIRNWKGPICQSSVQNQGREPIRLKEIVLFDLPLTHPGNTEFYGEGFQMLSQTGGTLAKMVDYSQYTDAKHYKMPMPAGTKVFYGMLTFSPFNREHELLAFTSSNRFNGQFYVRDSSLQVVVDTEGLELKPGESWDLEEFTFRSGPDREELLESLAQRLNINHPPLRFPSPPTGWCSWYCFGPRVTAQQVRDNLDFIAKHSPELKYIQIDDGYQPAMGDWLETGAAFGGNVQGVLKDIRVRGFEPAIWVAPFIAEQESNLFKQHPDWFVKDSEGKPLRSDRVTFGGWRRGPWYALDGTHPEAQKHLEMVFRTMREEWGCTYFKLDANFWGAIHGGNFYDRNATRVEAYRRGMEAVIRGAGDSFILGCNHPLWASLGLIHGSRSSNDIKRSWDRFKSTARQNLKRNWQNGRLWWNDPDAIVLMGDLPLNEFQFHATVIYASGGMVLSGDDLTQISSERLGMLRRLLPPSGVAATFADDSLSVGVVDQGGTRTVCLFNWEDKAQTISFRLPKPSLIKDYWSGEPLGRHRGIFKSSLAPRSARLLVCT